MEAPALPEELLLPAERESALKRYWAAGVWNLPVRGERMGLAMDQRAGRMELEGPALDKLALPAGIISTSLANGERAWLGALPPASGLAPSTAGGD